jgi:hypothetical protein
VIRRDETTRPGREVDEVVAGERHNVKPSLWKFLRELRWRWRIRLSDSQAIKISEWRCRWFPYRTCDWYGPCDYGPTRWQWPDVLGKKMRG